MELLNLTAFDLQKEFKMAQFNRMCSYISFLISCKPVTSVVGILVCERFH